MRSSDNRIPTAQLDAGNSIANQPRPSVASTSSQPAVSTLGAPLVTKSSAQFEEPVKTIAAQPDPTESHRSKDAATKSTESKRKPSTATEPTRSGRGGR